MQHEKFWTEAEEKSGRFPWTYSADAIREMCGGTNISRSTAAYIKSEIAASIGINERILAEAIAIRDYGKKNGIEDYGVFGYGKEHMSQKQLKALSSL